MCLHRDEHFVPELLLVVSSAICFLEEHDESNILIGSLPVEKIGRRDSVPQKLSHSGMYPGAQIDSESRRNIPEYHTSRDIMVDIIISRL